MSVPNRIIKNTGYLYVKIIVSSFVLLYTTRLVLNCLGVSDYGIFTVVGGTITMLSFLNISMATATQRFMSFSIGAGKENEQIIIFNISVILHLLIALIIVAILLIAGYFLFQGLFNIPQSRIFASKVIYGCLIISTFFTMTTVPYDATMNAHENMKYYSIIGIMEAFLKLTIAYIILYINTDKLILYGILMASIPIISMTIMRLYCRYHYNECHFNPNKYYDKVIMRKMLSFAGWNFVGCSSDLIGNNGNEIVLNHFFGTVLSATMGIGNQVFGMLSVFSTNLQKAINPIIVKEEGCGETNLMLYYTYKGCKYSFILTALFAFPFIIESHSILKLWLKDIPFLGIAFTQLSLVKSLITQLSLSLNTALGAKGTIKELNIFSFILNLAPLPILCILFHYGFSSLWIFYSVIIAGIILWAYKLFICRLYCGLRLFNYTEKVIVPCAIISISVLSIGCLVRLLMQESLFRLIISTLLMTIALILSTYLTMDKQEKKGISQICLNLRNKYYRK